MQNARNIEIVQVDDIEPGDYIWHDTFTDNEVVKVTGVYHQFNWVTIHYEHEDGWRNDSTWPSYWEFSKVVES